MKRMALKAVCDMSESPSARVQKMLKVGLVGGGHILNHRYTRAFEKIRDVVFGNMRQGRGLCQDDCWRVRNQKILYESF